jgi:HSP20 family molecular chaperone IbpA
MMQRQMRAEFANLDRAHREMINSMQGPRGVSAKLHKIWRPPTDVYETGDAIFVRVEIAGMQEKDFQVALNGRRLSISGVRHDSDEKLGFQQMEIQYGPFETDLHLPRAVQEDKIEATYQGGFLLISLPKATARRVPVTNV